MRHMMRILLVVVVVLGCLACAPRVMTLEDVGRDCYNTVPVSLDENMSESPCSQASRQNICSTYQTTAGFEYSSEAACVDACYEAKNRLVVTYTLESCMREIRDGASLCAQYCRGHY